MKQQIPEAVSTAVDTAKFAQFIHLVKENQLVTALVLFCLWQTGALLTVSQEVSGVMC